MGAYGITLAGTFRAYVLSCFVRRHLCHIDMFKVVQYGVQICCVWQLVEGEVDFDWLLFTLSPVFVTGLQNAFKGNKLHGA